MRTVALTTKCTAQLHGGGRFCDEPSLPDAPFPICARHARQAYEFGCSLVALAERDRWGPGRLPSPLSSEYASLLPRTVYYLRVGDLIKIGSTGDLKQRMSTYPPNRTLLATERGNAVVERQRLAQFRAHLRHGNEWFDATAPDLLAHIETLRSPEPSPAIDLDPR